MLDLIEKEEIEYFFDIGANIGYFTILLALKTKLTHLYGYEPLKRNFYQFGANILLNKLTDRVSAYNLALSDKTGSHEIWYNNQSTGIATLDRKLAGRAAKDYRIHKTIECRVFDDLHPIEDKVVLVKIDVEGLEEKVLKGMSKFLKNNQVYLFVEINSKQEKVAKMLEKMGFYLLDIKADDFVFSNVDHQQL